MCEYSICVCVCRSLLAAGKDQGGETPAEDQARPAELTAEEPEG